MSDNPYTVLGLSTDATDDEVKARYRKLAMEFHPDRNAGDKTAEKRFKEINEANDKIKNGWSPNQGNPFQDGNPFSQHGPAFHNFEDILAAFGHRRRNADIQAECRITLEEAFSGKDVTVNIRTQTQNRSISVTIPAGAISGMRMRIPQAGDNSLPNMTPGDLYVTIIVVPHSLFTVEGKDLLMAVKIDVFDVMLSRKFTVVTIEGQTVEIGIPVGFDPTNKLRVAGRGMPDLNKGSRGDLLVRVDVIFPKLTEKQKEFLVKAKENQT